MRELVTFFNKQTFVISIFGINRVNFTYVNEVIMMPILGLMVFFFFFTLFQKVNLEADILHIVQE